MDKVSDWVGRRLSDWGHTRQSQLGLAAVTGAVTGLVVAGFDWLVARQVLDRLATAPVVLQVVAPALGLGLAALALRYLAGSASPATADEYIHNFHEPGVRLNLRPVLGRLVAAATTLGLGGAMGFEGPSIYAGAALGTGLQARFRRLFDPVDAKVLMVAGAAAGVAAIFKTPATGAIFAIEVPYQDDTAKRMLFPALIASATGYLVFAAINGTAPLFPITGSPPFGLRELVGAAALGLLAGGGARVFAAMIRWSKRWQQRVNPVVSAAVGGASLAALIVVSRIAFGQSLTLGSGYNVIAWIGQGHHALWAIALLLVLRGVATPATAAGGGAGGLFIPLVVMGALLGALCGGVVHEPTTTLFPVIGVAAFLGAGYRTPLAAVMFVAESTGRPGFIVPGLIAAVVSQLVMGRQSVSVYQSAQRTSPLEDRFAMPLAAALQTDVATVPSDLTIDELVAGHLLATRRTTVPVLDGSRYVGMLRVEDLSDTPREGWSTTRWATCCRSSNPGPRWAGASGRPSS